MPRTNVYINRQLCDFEQVEGLPIELNVSIDKFMEVDSRLSGTRMDGGLQQLVLPATKTNAVILGAFWEFGATIDSPQDITIDVDGQIVFAGKCKPTEVIRSWTRPKQYFLELFGGNGDPLSALENVLLTDIDMGGQATDSGTVTGSWSHNFSSSAATATFAPVSYGRPVANNPQKYYHQLEDLRPHITYTHIFNKIFESYLGYKINSTFYDSETFRRMHYLFGVGDQWERNDSVANYEFEYTLNSALSGTPPVGLNKIPYGTVASDPSSMWDAAGHFFTAPIDGYYQFDIVYQITSPGTSFNLYITTYGPGAHNLIESQYTVSAPQTIEHRMTLPKQFYSAGQNFFIISNAADTSVEVNANSSIKGWLDTAAYMGSEIAIETCLHKQPVKYFLRGVFHQFNLTGRFEVITKQFYFEPRMSYFTSDSIGSGHSTTFARTEYDGYYQRPLTASEDWNDKINPDTIRIKKLFPFGDSLTLGYKEGIDSVTKQVLAFEGLEDGEGNPPVYGVKYPMNDAATERSEVVSRNPYFHILPNLFVNEIQASAKLPAMLPDGYNFDGPLPEPTFEFRPTCGYYYGLSGLNAWNYDGTDRTLPMMYQQPPQGGQYFIQGQDCITYNSTGDFLGGIRSENKGLVENYYINYLQCIKHGELIEASATLRPEEVFSETFTTMKYFLDNHFILVNIGRYNPLTNIAQCTFWRYTYGMTSAEYTAFEAGQSTIYNTLVTK